MKTLLLPLLLSCGSEPAEPEASDTVLVELDAPVLLRRMSLDLRGVLPSAEELDAVEADPSKLDGYMDQYLDDARLEERLVSLLAERWHTRLDDFELGVLDFGLSDEDEFALERSAGEEPLRLMAHVAVSDLHWSEVVTADYTMANELLGEIWPIDYPEGGSGWEVSYYNDGRPPVGVLASTGLWWRYVTNVSNMNRGRAAAISRLLLCQDLLSRPVSLSGAVSLSDADGISTAIRTNPSCVACHSTVDPLAASLFGWWTQISYNPPELDNYHPEREPLGEDYLGFAPAYFGQPLNGFVDLGPAIANDSRFYTCAVETAAEMLWRRETDLQDFDRLESLRQAFMGNDARFRPLIRAVMETPEYRAGAFEDEASEDEVSHEITWRLAPPDLLKMMVEDLTGFVWSYEGFSQMENGDPGYRTEAGGVDGYTVTRPQQDPGITWAITIKRFAQAAADYAVQQELVGGAERRLFSVVTLDDRPGDERFRQELDALCWRLYAVRPDADRVAAYETTWSAIEGQEGPAEAWTRLVSAMLRDPEFVAY